MIAQSTRRYSIIHLDIKEFIAHLFSLHTRTFDDTPHNLSYLTKSVARSLTYLQPVVVLSTLTHSFDSFFTVAITRIWFVRDYYHLR